MLESRLDGGGELTAEDVFNCFRDLWEDARAWSRNRQAIWMACCGNCPGWAGW